MGISDHATTLDNFKGRARLFPLPNLVLFPHVVQPLHIFEPRYRQMMRECLLDDRVLAMALVTTKHGSSFFGDPPLHPVICVGKVFKEEILPDGRINLLLHGVARGRISKRKIPKANYTEVPRWNSLTKFHPPPPRPLWNCANCCPEAWPNGLLPNPRHWFSSEN